MDYRRILLTLLAVSLAVAVCLAVIRTQALQDLVQEGLILPLYYAAWLAGLLVRSVDQPLLWAVGLIALGLLLAYGLAVAWPEQLQRRKSRKFEEGRLPEKHGRVYFWQNRIESLRSQGLDSEYATFEFRRIAQTVKDTSDKNGVIEQADHSPEIEVFFKRKAAQNGWAPTPRFNWRERLNWQLTTLTRRKQPPERDPLAELCTYLEGQLEIDHDDSD
jgi:hypothetical protein